MATVGNSLLSFFTSGHRINEGICYKCARSVSKNDLERLSGASSVIYGDGCKVSKEEIDEVFKLLPCIYVLLEYSIDRMLLTIGSYNEIVFDESVEDNAILGRLEGDQYKEAVHSIGISHFTENDNEKDEKNFLSRMEESSRRKIVYDVTDFFECEIYGYNDSMTALGAVDVNIYSKLDKIINRYISGTEWLNCREIIVREVKNSSYSFVDSAYGDSPTSILGVDAKTDYILKNKFGAIVFPVKRSKAGEFIAEIKSVELNIIKDYLKRYDESEGTRYDAINDIEETGQFIYTGRPNIKSFISDSDSVNYKAGIRRSVVSNKHYQMGLSNTNIDDVSIDDKAVKIISRIDDLPRDKDGKVRDAKAYKITNSSSNILSDDFIRCLINAVDDKSEFNDGDIYASITLRFDGKKTYSALKVDDTYVIYEVDRGTNVSITADARTAAKEIYMLSQMTKDDNVLNLFDDAKVIDEANKLYELEPLIVLDRFVVFKNFANRLYTYDKSNGILYSLFTFIEDLNMTEYEARRGRRSSDVMFIISANNKYGINAILEASTIVDMVQQ